MKRARYANVWDAIERDSAQAENLKLRSSLILALRKHIERKGSARLKRQEYSALPSPGFQT